MRKTRSKKGFTLAELLIVVAVIAILVAIAIPVFKSQLDKATEQVAAANERAAASMAIADYMLDENVESGDGATYYYAIDGKQNMTKVDAQPSSGAYVTVEIGTNDKVTSSTYTDGK